MIIRGGENIDPREVEEFLYTHPSIVAVQVVGVPDRKFGEAVAAWVKLQSSFTLTMDELKSSCKGKLADFKFPRYLKVNDDFLMVGYRKNSEIQGERDFHRRVWAPGIGNDRCGPWPADGCESLSN